MKKQLIPEQILEKIKISLCLVFDQPIINLFLGHLISHVIDVQLGKKRCAIKYPCAVTHICINLTCENGDINLTILKLI
jgi:hypothetical protein